MSPFQMFLMFLDPFQLVYAATGPFGAY